MPQKKDEFQYVALPDGSYGRFPSSMKDSDIESAIKNSFPVSSLKVGDVSSVSSSPKYEPLSTRAKAFLPRHGAMLGAQLPGVAAGAAGLATGGNLVAAGLGGMAGESGRELLQSKYPQYFGAAPPSRKETLEQLGEQGGLGVAQEFGAKLGGKALRQFRVPRVGEAAEAERVGVTLHSGQQVEKGLARTLGKFGEKGESGSEFLRGQSSELIRKFDVLESSLGLSHDETKAAVEPLYHEIDEMVRPRQMSRLPGEGETVLPKGIPYNPEMAERGVVTPRQLQGETMPAPVNLRPARSRITGTFRDALNVARKNVLPTDVSRGDAVLRDIESNWKGRVSFGEAQNIRSRLLQIMRDKTDLYPEQLKAVATKAEKEITRQMDVAAQLYERQHPGSGLMPKYRAASKLWREGTERARFGDLLDKGRVQSSMATGSSDYIDAHKLDSIYRQMKPAERDGLVPRRIQPAFEALLRVGKRTSVPRSATGTFLDFARDTAFDALNTPTGRTLLTTGWSLPAGTKEAIAMMARIEATRRFTNPAQPPERPQ